MHNTTQAIKKILLHTVAVYVAMLAGLLLSAVIILIVPGAGQTSTIIGRALDPPFWLPEVVCGALLGGLVRRRFAIRLAGLGVIIPAVLLVLDVVFEGLRMRTFTPLADIYFSANSGATEGAYKLMFVAPLYTAIAYALGALAAKLIKTEPREAKPAPWSFFGVRAPSEPPLSCPPLTAVWQSVQALNRPPLPPRKARCLRHRE